MNHPYTSLVSKLRQGIEQMWLHKGLGSTLLLPLSWITWLVNWRKRIRYAHKSGLTTHSRHPVVVVGNIFVGGTGKTPVVIALCKALAERGWKPGVISRGYGAAIGEKPVTGRGVLDPAIAGDEPALIARETGVPIAVHPKRALALARLEKDYPEVDIIVSDDGLQHLALGRDLEIIVQDSRGTGNGRLLPAGPLREPAIRLNTVDFLITNGTADELGPVTHTQTTAQEDSTTDEEYETIHALWEGTTRSVRMTLMPCVMEHLNTRQQLGWSEWYALHGSRPCSAVAGIGHPVRFFDMLRSSGLTLDTTRALPDHYAYTDNPFAAIASLEPILVTPKDAIKCKQVADDRIWVVHAEPVFSNPQWFDLAHDILHLAKEQKRKKKRERPVGRN